MPSDEYESDLSGPGVDLSIALSGILMVVIVVTVIQLWLTSIAAKQAEARVQDIGLTQAQILSLRDLLDAERRRADIEAKGRQEAEDNLRTANEAIRRLRDQLKLLEAKLNEEMQKRQAAERNLKAANDSVEKLKDELRVIGGKLNEEVQKRQAAERAVKAADASIEKLKDQLKETEAKLNEEMRNRQLAEEALRIANQENSRLKRELEAAKAKNDRPPLITISDAAFRTFEGGSSEISQALGTFLRTDVVKQLYSLRDQYQANVVEIMGHTDEVRLGPSKRTCNLDDNLLDVLNDRKDIKELGPCDNVGLGMARATAVVNELKRLGLGKDFILLPASAGAAINTNDTMAYGGQMDKPNAARRRIEIRLRRHGE